MIEGMIGSRRHRDVIGGWVIVEEGHVSLNDLATGNPIGCGLVGSSEEGPLGSVDD